jgi:GxxExxY protein
MARVERACEDVFRALGKGHSEAVYHAAVEVALRELGLRYQREVVVPVKYNDHTVGMVRLDLLVEAALVVELKAVASELRWTEHSQMLMYLRLLPPPCAGLLVNFSQSQNRSLELARFPPARVAPDTNA